MTFHSISLAPTPCSQVPDHDLTALTPGLPIHTMYSQRNFPGYHIQRTEDTETDRSCLHDMTTWWKNQETLKLMWEQDSHIREEWQGPEEGHTVLKNERNQPREKRSREFSEKTVAPSQVPASAEHLCSCLDMVGRPSWGLGWSRPTLLLRNSQIPTVWTTKTPTVYVSFIIQMNSYRHIQMLNFCTKTLTNLSLMAHKDYDTHYNS